MNTKSSSAPRFVRTCLRIACFVIVYSRAGAAESAQPAEALNLETALYIYKNDALTHAGAGNSHSPDASPPEVLHSPDKIEFGEQYLSLEGDAWSWKPAHPPVSSINLIASPTLSLKPRRAVSVLSSAPLQYMEKLANGELQVRQLPADSPEAPHFRLTFTLGEEDRSTEVFPVACEADIATVRGREPIAGVALDVGKPLLQYRRESLTPTLPRDQWTALLLGGPESSDHSFLVLLKISSGTSESKTAASAMMSASELEHFVTFYYLHPEPELIAKAMASMSTSGVLPNRAPLFTGFFAQVFAAHPEFRDAWKKVSDAQNGDTREFFRLTREWSRPGAIAESKRHTAEIVELCWGAFFASGDPIYVRKIAEQLRYFAAHGFEWSPKFHATGVAAMWTLATRQSEHPQVRRALESMRQDPDPQIRQLINDLLEKDLAALREEVDRNNATVDVHFAKTPTLDTNTEHFSYGPQPAAPPPPQPPFVSSSTH